MISALKAFIRNNIFYNLYKLYKAKLAIAIYNDPSKDMFVIGITGTNGKTTSSFIIHHIFNTLVDKAFLLGTNEIKYGTEAETNTSKMTSPDPMKIQEYLSRAKEKWCKIAVLEVASHGISQQRFHGINFDMAILTNITEEHLDYHHTMEEYANIKKQLFIWVLNNPKPNKLAILPKDDKFWRQRAEELWFDRMMTYSIIGSWSLKAENVIYSVDKTSFDINYMGELFPVTTNMVGMHNVYNIICALSSGVIVWLDLKQMIDTLQTFVPPLGRMETIIHDDVHYFVDFAHTPDGLEKTLSFLYKVKDKGRVILLSWAMGERDRFKRPSMGKIADQYADIIVLADEDPWEEPRFQIIQEIKDGINRSDGENLFIIPDRQLAIKFITEITQPWDLVLLAGKGHETVMCIPGWRIPRNERAILEAYLAEKQDKK